MAILVLDPILAADPREIRYESVVTRGGSGQWTNVRSTRSGAASSLAESNSLGGVLYLRDRLRHSREIPSVLVRSELRARSAHQPHAASLQHNGTVRYRKSPPPGTPVQQAQIQLAQSVRQFPEHESQLKPEVIYDFARHLSREALFLNPHLLVILSMWLEKMAINDDSGAKSCAASPNQLGADKRRKRGGCFAKRTQVEAHALWPVPPLLTCSH